ncbi:hypothetical protein [Gandjariella thermophila]|uniref:DUF1273 domain-containing protein n=1 Tax=Gandjariella thermophila TaxID=1931992 RepID=A0A4D4J0K8_9PSEU|nr:hypothetical protein [Gandjariella thermophila]GDY28894.1 hypothetical protein GTS_05270 [Gandjariella thermophila]
MTRIGVTGHSNLTRPSVPLVTDALREAVEEMRAELAGRAGGVDLTGVTCLAPGADQLFARVVLELGGRVEVVLPAKDYRASLDPARRAEFDELVAAAAEVRVLPFARSGRPAYQAAGDEVVSSVQGVVAVWDGQPGGRPGSTAGVVARARERGVPVRVVWPSGARRDG